MGGSNTGYAAHQPCRDAHLRIPYHPFTIANQIVQNFFLKSNAGYSFPYRAVPRAQKQYLRCYGHQITPSLIAKQAQTVTHTSLNSEVLPVPLLSGPTPPLPPLPPPPPRPPLLPIPTPPCNTPPPPAAADDATLGLRTFPHPTPPPVPHASTLGVPLRAGEQDLLTTPQPPPLPPPVPPLPPRSRLRDPLQDVREDVDGSEPGSVAAAVAAAAAAAARVAGVDDDPAVVVLVVGPALLLLLLLLMLVSVPV